MHTIPEVQAALTAHYAELDTLGRQQEGLRIKERETQRQIDRLAGYLDALQAVAKSADASRHQNKLRSLI